MGEHRSRSLFAVAVILLAACTPYRPYPLLKMDLARPDHGPAPEAFEPSGVAVLADGTVVISSAGPANVLYEPESAGRGASLAPVGFNLPLRDPRLDCPTCRRPPFRATARLTPHPVSWLPYAGRDLPPLDVEDLAPFGGDEVLGITAYSTIGRRTGYRKDNTALPRQETERIFVLERMADPPVESGEVGHWEERRVPEVDRMRDALSDWGRSHCDGDMRVQGLAWNPVDGVAYVGLRRCDGPVVRVLSYDLRASAAGQAVDLVVAAEGVDGGAGPEEGITGLHWAEGGAPGEAGTLWATTAWDSWGHETEPAWGGRLAKVEDGLLRPVGSGFLDRPSAVCIPARDPLATSGEPDQAAVVLFDDDTQKPEAPVVTFVATPLPRPAGGAWAGLASLTDLGEGLPLGLNGFDLRWYERDHRLAQFDVVLDRRPDGTPGAWTRAIGGLWQMRVGGSLGLIASATHLSRWVGHDRQAVALTDWKDSPNLRFHAFRADVSVVPRDRERVETGVSAESAPTAGPPSVARLVKDLRPDYTVTVPLPTPASPDAGLVLQGFEIDTAARADRGICLAAMSLGATWHSPAHDAVDLRTMLIGGLCNDFDTRGSGLQHGRTTDVAGGVTVAVRFAVVEGGKATPWSSTVADQDLPAPRDALGNKIADPTAVTDDVAARAHVHCVRLADNADLAPGDPSWRHLDITSAGDSTYAGALSGFTLALDPVGFAGQTSELPLTEAQALNRNAYIHRYLLRAFGGTGAVVEGGITHGIHRTGFMRDNQTPSALLLEADLTGFAGEPGQTWDMLAPSRRADPNLEPEDGFVRWAVALPRSTEAKCSSAE